jgi:hypothetical protein
MCPMKSIALTTISCLLLMHLKAQDVVDVKAFKMTKSDSMLIDSVGLMVIDSDFNLITGDTILSNRFNSRTLLVSDENDNLSFIADTAGEYDEEYFAVNNNTNFEDTDFGNFAEEVKTMNEMKSVHEEGTSTELLISDLMSDSSEVDFINNYYIIVGSGRNLPALMKVQDEINAVGYQTEIIQNDKKTWYHIVLVGLYTKSESTSTVFKLREQGFREAWRMKLDI